MGSPARLRPGWLAGLLFLGGLALVVYDGWRWWSHRRLPDDGGYAERVDWSAKFGGGSHVFGFTFRDRNRNGRFDADDSPMAWVAVEMTAPGGVRTIVRTNLSGFANIDMSLATRGAPVHGPGDYTFRFLVPPGFTA